MPTLLLQAVVEECLKNEAIDEEFQRRWGFDAASETHLNRSIKAQSWVCMVTLAVSCVCG